MNVRRLVPALCAVLALTLAACTTGSSPTPSPTAAIPATATRDVNALPRDRVRDGGLLRFSLTTLPNQWNPRHADAAAEDASRILAPLTPQHFTLDAAGRATANPDFIVSVEVENSPATSVTLHLNPLARWGDGTKITADDWIATWRVATGRVAGVTASNLPGWQRVTEVAAGDTPADVVITFSGSEPDWAEPLVAGPLRGSAVGSADAWSWTTYDASRYASPFTVTHVDTVQGVITLQRNPLWWGDSPKLDQIMFRTVQPEAVAAAFQHNELDVWEIGSSEDRLQQSKAAADTTLRTAPSKRGRILQIATTGALSDIKVRRGVIQAIDRATLAAVELDVAPGTVTAWSNLLLLPTQPGYVDEARATGVSFDAAQASTTLTQAGWVTGSDGLRRQNGQALELTYTLDPADSAANTEFTQLSGQLLAVGITLLPVSHGGDLTPEKVTVSPFPLAHLPAAATQTLYSDLVTKISTEQDAVRRADQAGQLARALWQEATTVTLYQIPQQVAVRDGLANYGAPAFGSTDWEDVGWAS